MAKTEHVFSCPIGETLDVFAGRWKPEILWQLQAGPMRFNQLLRAIGKVSQKMLTQQLRELQRDGLVTRAQYWETTPKVEYMSTELAHSLEPIFSALVQWRDKHGEHVLQARHSYDEATQGL
ncbi:MAG: helix-turn-helix transcriptional regulator [Vampirovibrio sp.]|nr:helix-turn-helix transcriptional regulator [Vampirovibrio sp.]